MDNAFGWESLKATCIFCGREETVPVDSADYKKIKFVPNTPYICSVCRKKIHGNKNT